MAKISPVSIKYMIHAKFEAVGPVEKPDVIGALFGQTEGLLGSDLEIRDLQKEGKIGRIEVETDSSGGRTSGKIFIPTALDKSETSLIAAAIETIDKIGPTEAKISVEKIEDVRGNKRDYILDRAKRLLEQMDSSTNSREISDSLKTASRTSRVQEYGEEKLASGDLSGEEIIVVEGRADVINLLENRVNNVICMNGTKLPPSIIELSKNKSITLFLDGDRGGKLIAKNVIENADIDFIAFAPDGKEVEELSGKEILVSLRKKIPAKEFSSSFSIDNFKTENQNQRNIEKVESKEIKEINMEALKKFLKEEVEGSDKAFLLDYNLNIFKTVAKTRVNVELSRLTNIYVVAIDGKATLTLVKSAEEAGCKYLAAKNFVDVKESMIKFVSF
ncbi:MAG TPA: DNA primase DnaG [Candidatus Paceibacterota bacterium]|nr:DNA primase DnaG [Candidatus Paceibacterota bacterium]